MRKKTSVATTLENITVFESSLWLGASLKEKICEFFLSLSNYIVGKKFKYNSNTQDLCLHFKVRMVFLGERMPEEMFEKRRRFPTFFTLSHSFVMGNFLQFFASYDGKNEYSGEKNNSNPSPIEQHVLIYMFVCAQRCEAS